jgi:hypothetical protein
MTPMFVGGCPRSGTTLLGSMLGAHSEVVCLPEAPFIGALAASLRPPGPSDEAVALLHKQIRKDFKFAFWNIDPSDLAACLAGPPESYADVIAGYVSCFARSTGRPRVSHWVDHSPTNTMYSARLSAEFPDARFIHIVRDGRAVCASWIPLNWGPNTIMSGARSWVESVAYGLAAEGAMPADKIHRVSYEALVADPERILRGLCAWLDLSYQPSMLTGKGFQVPAYTRNQHGLVGQPASAERIDRWRTSLTARELEIFEAITGDMLVHLGYQLVTSGRGAEPSYLEKIAMEFVDRARQLAHCTTRPVRLRRFLKRAKHEASERGYEATRAAGR